MLLTNLLQTTIFDFPFSPDVSNYKPGTKGSWSSSANVIRNFAIVGRVDLTVVVITFKTQNGKWVRVHHSMSDD